MSDGPAYFTQPLFGGHPILDGVRLASMPASMKRNPSEGTPHLINMASGRNVLQVVGRPAGSSEAGRLFTWSWTEPGSAAEEDWDLLERLHSNGYWFRFADFAAVDETFVCTGGAETFNLRRPLADTIAGHDWSAWGARAWLDGVEQDVVTASPAADEVRVEDDEVEVPSGVTAGQRVRVRYYGAFRVAFLAPSLSLIDFNRVEMPVSLIELGEAT